MILKHLKAFLGFTILGLQYAAPQINAQISFYDATNALGNTEIKSGIPIAICDMNGDNLDDLIRLDEKKYLNIDFQDSSDGFKSVFYSEILGEAWSIAIADIDNDGDNDIATAGFYDKIKLIRSVNNAESFQNEIIDGLIFIQASNFADINNDGWVDYFTCHDDGHSRAHRNTDGTLAYDLSLFNTSSGNTLNDSGNYGSIWTDYDLDGDLDMYLSKCRLGVDSLLDPRRVNKMYRNNGDGSYTDVAEEIGLRPLGQSWVTDFADIDNDGDFDCMIINHDIESKIYLNNGEGDFEDITSMALASNQLDQITQITQLKFSDFDNDGYVDAFLCGVEGRHQLYRNNHDLSFTLLSGSSPSNSGEIKSFTTGDLNNDGRIDIIASYPSNYNGESKQLDKLLFNNTDNDNNYLKVKLTGRYSNSNAIGSKIIIHSDLGTQIREIRSGESYGVMHSFIANFGLGSFIAVDSMLIIWPLNQQTKILNPEINTIHILDEPFACIPSFHEIDLTICMLDSVFLAGSFQNQQGTYVDSLLDKSGCDSIITTDLSVYSETIKTRYLSICQGSNLILSGMNITESGIYPDTLIDAAGCDSIIVNDVTILKKYKENEIVLICPGDSVLIDNVYYENGDSLTLEFSTSSGCDSIIIQHFMSRAYEYDTLQVVLCLEDSIEINNQIIYSSGIYMDTLEDAECNKIDVYNVAFDELEVDFNQNQNLLSSISNNDFLHQWMLCEDEITPINDATNLEYEIEVSGEYALQVINPKTGCVFISECKNIIISSAADILLENNLIITPNPARTTIEIQNLTNHPCKDIKFVNMEGQSVLHYNTLDLGYKIDISELEAGMYFLIIHCESAIKIQKLLIY